MPPAVALGSVQTPPSPAPGRFAPVGERQKPLGVIANTVKGKGVSFMENKAAWHHGVPNAQQFEQAMKELV